MTYVALAAVVALAVVSSVYVRALAGLSRQHARERDLLVNQICNLSGKPWAPPPSDRWEPEPEPEPLRIVPPEYAEFYPETPEAG